MSSVRVVVDSHHSTWNWMGNYKLYDGSNSVITEAPPTLTPTQAPTQMTDAPTQAPTQTTEPPTQFTVSMVVGSSSNIYPPSVSHGSHSTSDIDPLKAWEGEMPMWKSPNGHDYEYLVSFAEPTAVSKLTLDYDAGATVILKNEGGTVLGSTDCYASNGGRTNECVVTSSSSSQMSSVLVVLDSHHSTWNWMGNYKLYDGSNSVIEESN